MIVLNHKVSRSFKMSIPAEKIQALQGLVKYTDFFSSPESDDICRWIEETDDNGNPVQVPTYKDELFDFIEAAYNSGVLEPDYINIMNRYATVGNELEEFIYSLPVRDFALCAAVLTCIIRQERFSPGLWGIATSEKWFLAVLKRMAELLED